MFEGLEWQEDCMKLKDLFFCLEGSSKLKPEIENSFSLYKAKQIYDQYEQLFAARPEFEARNILELGIWDGGSLVIWNEVFSPRKLVGIDFRKDRGDSKYFQTYLEKHDHKTRIKTCWGLNQADNDAVQEICRHEFDGQLDLIIDDASHFYEESKASFEMLFPKLRKGGLYVIEDWAWVHWPEFDEEPYFAGKTALSQLVLELTEMIGSARGLPPATLTILPAFVAIEKGELAIPDEEVFRLEKHIRRRQGSKPSPPPKLRVLS